MSLLDRLLRRRPALDRPRGGSGRWHSSGYLELEELNADLSGISGLRTFDKMYRTDPDCRRAVGMVANAVIGATWTIQPYGGREAADTDQQVAGTVAWALGIGDDAASSALSTPWLAHLAEFMPIVMRSGFTPGEIVWCAARRDGRLFLVPRRIGLVLPRAVFQGKWTIDPTGDLAGIEPYLPGRGIVELPIQDLVYYRVGAEGDNWEGVSMLRPCYKPWFFKDETERLDFIAQDLDATGLPVFYPPRAGIPYDADDMEQKLEALRQGELSFLMMPGPHAADVADGTGFRLDKWTAAGGGSESGGSARSQRLATLEYHRDGIAAAFFADFMRLGQGSGGSGARAVGDVQQDPFMASLEVLADIPRLEAQRKLVRRIVALNYGDDVGMPTLHCSLTSAALAEIRQYVGELIAKGALQPDDKLEDWLRDRGDLPAADPRARAERHQREQEDRELQVDGQKAAAEATRSGGASGPGGRTTAGRTGARGPRSDPDGGRRRLEHEGAGEQLALDAFALRRDLRPWEQLMDLDGLDAALRAHADRVVLAAGAHARALGRDLVAGAELPATPPEPPTALVDAIEGELRQLYDIGYRAVERELDAQRITVPGHGLAAQALARRPGDRLRARALITAAAVAAAAWEAVQRLRMRRANTSTAQRQRSAEDAAEQALRARARRDSGPTLNEGRGDAAQDHADEIVGARYTSILDPNRCLRCAQADDGVLRALTDPVRLAQQPPNPECEGWDRCRCMEFFQLQLEMPAGV